MDWLKKLLSREGPDAQCTFPPSVKLLFEDNSSNMCTADVVQPMIYDDARQMCIPNPFLSNQATTTTSTSTIPSGITFGANANRSAVSDYTLKLLAEIMAESKNPKIIITSTLRTATDQARAMYDNIISKGFAYNYDLYGRTGDKVIKAAEKAMKKKKSKEEIMAAMVAEINRIGPGKVSRHAGDPKVINVVDIAPSTISNQAEFVKAVKARKIFLLQPPADPAFHLEIRQPGDEVLP